MQWIEALRQNVPWVISAATCASGCMMWAVHRLRKRRLRLTSLEKGVQALLRASMIDQYNRAAERGCAPMYARDNFQNLWEQYEALGKNGVMNDIYTRFMALPLAAEKGEGK